MKQILACLALWFAATAGAQQVRWDYIATTTAKNVAPGAQAPLYAIPNAAVAFYSCSGALVSSCTIPLTTYTDVTGATPCSTSTQVVLSGTNVCTALADAQGNFGGWFAASGTYGYAYTITYSGSTFGPYPFTVGGGGGGGGSITLQTNSANNGSQTLLNLVKGNGINITNSGGVTTISQAPAFAISSFTCSTCGTVEIGATVASPTNFTATYTVATTSGTVSDGTNNSTLSPANSTSQSGSLAFSYVKTSAASQTFTLTAVGPTTQTASQSITWAARVFGGVGTAGATGATASTTNAVLAGATGTLASVGLGNQSTYGPFTASGQKMYVLTTGGSHTFKDANTGFSFAFNTPTAVTFTNQYGDAVAMYLYESTNTLTGSFTLSETN